MGDVEAAGVVGLLISEESAQHALN